MSNRADRPKGSVLVIAIGGLGLVALNFIPIDEESNWLLGSFWLAWTVIGVAWWSHQYRMFRRSRPAEDQ